MVIVHGLAEHSGRYERTGRLLSEAGIEVIGQDLRGHGASAGERGHVEHWRDFLDDVEDALGRARSTAGTRSVVLLGHSFGGLISTDYVTSGRPAPDLLVLSSPALADRLPGWQHAMAPKASPGFLRTRPSRTPGVLMHSRATRRSDRPSQPTSCA